MKKFLLLLLVVAIFTGCSGMSSEVSNEDVGIPGNYAPGQTVVAFDYVHGGYVGKTEIKTDDEGNLSVYFDDAFLPHTLALVDIEASEWNPDNTTGFISKGNEKFVAKYIEYNSKIYIAVPTGIGFSYVEADENGEATGSIDLEKAILRNQASMAAYYALIPAGKFKTLSSIGGTATSITTTSYGGVTKKVSPGYWAKGQTWIGNITAIEDYIAEYGVQVALTDMVRAKEENADGLKLWKVADTVTGATNSDFKDYFGLAQAAVGRLRLK